LNVWWTVPPARLSQQSADDEVSFNSIIPRAESFIIVT